MISRRYGPGHDPFTASDRFCNAAAALLLAVALAACSGRGPAGRAAATSTTAATPTTPAPSTGTAPSTTATTAGTTGDRCTAAMLALTSGEGRGALGHALYVLQLRNTSSRTCRMAGYPSVTVLDANGRVLAEAQGGTGYLLPDRPVTQVALAAGATAYVGVESYNVCTGGADPVASTTVRLAPPADTAAVSLALEINVCAGQPVRVSPVRATEQEIAP